MNQPSDVLSPTSANDNNQELTIKEQQTQLLQEKERIEAEHKNTVDEIKKLMSAENPTQGIFFAQEIHKLKQKLNCLTIELQFCNNKIKRLNY